MYNIFLTTDLFWTCSLKKTARRWMIRFESRCMSLPNLGAVIVNARMVKTKRLPLATLVFFWFLLEWEWLGYSVFFGKELRVMFTRVVIRIDMPLSSGNVGDPQKARQSTEEKQPLGLISFSEATSIHLIIPLWNGVSSCQSPKRWCILAFVKHCCALALGINANAVAGRGLPTEISGQLCTFKMLSRLRRTQRGRQINSFSLGEWCCEP